MRVGLNLGHPRYVTMPFRKKGQQSLIEPIDFGTHIIFGFAFGRQLGGGHGKVLG